MTDSLDAFHEDELAAYGRRVKEEPRMRRFPYLGWTVLLVPIDLHLSRSIARMVLGTVYGLQPAELVELRARRITMDGEPERVWWLYGVPAAAEARILRRMDDA